MTTSRNELRDKLRALVIGHTKDGSRHQQLALSMLGTHLQRGFVPEIKNLKCDECGDRVQVVRWTDQGMICDSWGYVESSDGNDNRCYRCLDEGYIGDIYSPKKRH